MINKSSLLTLALMATSSLAFAPPKVHRVVQRAGVARSTDVMQSNSALFMSEARVDESSFLVVDTTAVENEVADNWGWVVASGAVTLLLGLAAFGYPIFSTGVAYDTTILTLGFTAVTNLIYTLKVDDGQKLKYLLSVPVYGFLAYYMNTHPMQGLDVITLTIASVISAEGIYEAAVAAKNEDIEGRPWLFASGIGSVLAALWLALNIPVSSLFVPGAALGARLTSSGAGKVALGLAGKDIADERAI